jgi:ankyrin repeat protein
MLPLLPTELILLIIQYLDLRRDLNAVCQINRSTYRTANVVLYLERAEESHGELALEWAIVNGQPSTARMALEAGTEYCNAMLHEAAAQGHAGMIKLLVEYAYAPGVTPWSARRGYTVNIDEIDGFWEATPLALAAKGGHESAVRLLLDLGASVDVEDFEHRGLKLTLSVPPVDVGKWQRQGLTLLGCAAHGGNMRVVRMLVEADCRAGSARSPWIIAPLVIAALRGYYDVVVFLLDAGGDHSRDQNRSTALDLAAEVGHAAIVRLLVDRDTVPTSRTLESAVRGGYREIVEYLICHGAICTIESLLTAARAGQPDLVDLLMQHVKYAPTAKDIKDQACLIYVASVCGYLNLLNKYILRGWSVEQHVKGKVHVGSPLAWAAKEGHTEIVQLLLSNGADPHGKCNPGCGEWVLYPLRVATERGHLETVEILLDHGADPKCDGHGAAEDPP